LSLKHLHIRNNGIFREIITNDFHILKEQSLFSKLTEENLSPTTENPASIEIWKSGYSTSKKRT